MYLKLIRNKANGSAITGRLVIDGRWFCNTLERKGYQILALFYPVKVTMSPKFKRLLPLVCGVPQSRSSGVQEFRSSGVTSEQAQSATAHSLANTRSSECEIRTSEHLNSSSAASEHLNSKASEPRSPLRTGIRFHAGWKPEHSTGCILVPDRATEDKLTQIILKTQNNHEEIILEVIDFRPGTELGYNTPCPSSECACEKEIRAANFARRHSSSILVLTKHSDANLNPGILAKG